MFSTCLWCVQMSVGEVLVVVGVWWWWWWWWWCEFVSLYRNCIDTVLCHCIGNGTGCRTAAMAAPLPLTSGPARCEAALHGCGRKPVCLFYSIATTFEPYHDGDMMYEMRRRKPKPTLLPTQGIFNLPYHIGIVWEDLAFDDAISYTYQGKWIAIQSNVMAVTGIRIPFQRVTYNCRCMCEFEGGGGECSSTTCQCWAQSGGILCVMCTQRGYLLIQHIPLTYRPTYWWCTSWVHVAVNTFLITLLTVSNQA